MRLLFPLDYLFECQNTTRNFISHPTPHPALFSCLCPVAAGDGEKDALPHCSLQVYTYTCDVGKRENVYSTAERVRKEVGEVSVLVNNAGVVSGHHLLECPDELIERTMMVNCHAHFWVTINSLLLPFFCQLILGN